MPGREILRVDLMLTSNILDKVFNHSKFSLKVMTSLKIAYFFDIKQYLVVTFQNSCFL